MQPTNGDSRLRAIAPDDPRLAWNGAIALEVGEGWVAPWRTPLEERELYWPEGGLGRAAMPSGVRLAFTTDSDVVRLHFDQRPPPLLPDPQERPRLDLACDGEIVASVPIEGLTDVTFAGLPAGSKRLELWLPHFSQFRVRRLELRRDATLEAWPDPHPTWVAYGSSITQGRGADSPSRTWPARVARAEDLDLLCLGFGAGCFAEPMFARFVRDLPFDVLSLCLGINVWFKGSMSPAMFRNLIVGFVKIVRERHGDAPIAIVSPILAPECERRPGPEGSTLEEYRDAVAAAALALTGAGDPALLYVDGRELFGEGDLDLFIAEAPDRYHPCDAGHALMAHRYRSLIVEPHFGAAIEAARSRAAAPAA